MHRLMRWFLLAVGWGLIAFLLVVALGAVAAISFGQSPLMPFEEPAWLLRSTLLLAVGLWLAQVFRRLASAPDAYRWLAHRRRPDLTAD